MSAELLERLTREVEEDEECKQLIEELLQYALYAVNKHLDSIRHTLKNREAALQWPCADGAVELDLLWPGAGYNSVACGGSFEVLSLLEKEGLVKIFDIMGASGGAASSILALADKDRSSRTLLKNYVVYAKWAEETRAANLRQVFKATSLWTAIYRKVIQDNDAFQRVSEHGYVAVAGGRSIFQWQNWILHNFQDREQLVQAYEASGEASLSGALLGNTIHGLKERIGSFSDGGGILPFPSRKRMLVYHHTFYGYGTSCTLESIRELFEKSVDETILMLCESWDLAHKKNAKYGGLVMTTGPELTWTGISNLRTNARFLNVLDDEEETELP